MQYDVKALVTNLRKSKNAFATGYRPAFQIRMDYLSTGEIILIDKSSLDFGDTAEAFIRFLTPNVYPFSLWEGKKVYFMEGDNITGEATIKEIYNSILKAQ